MLGTGNALVTEVYISTVHLVKQSFQKKLHQTV